MIAWVVCKFVGHIRTRPATRNHLVEIVVETLAETAAETLALFGNPCGNGCGNMSLNYGNCRRKHSRKLLWKHVPGIMW